VSMMMSATSSPNDNIQMVAIQIELAKLKEK
jgi:hypothetical protein